MKAFCLFCEDIRHEVDNRRSFIGAFRGAAVQVPSAPHLFPRLCIFVELEIQSGEEFSKARLEITDIDNSQQFVDLAGSATVAQGKMQVVGYETTISPYIVEKSGSLRVRLLLDDREIRFRPLSFQVNSEHEAEDTPEKPTSNRGPAKRRPKKRATDASQPNE